MSRRRKSNNSGLLIVVAVALLAVWGLPRLLDNLGGSAICDADPDKTGYCLVDSTDYDAVVFVVGNTQNSPTPAIFLDNTDFDNILRSVFYSDNASAIKIVSAAGDNHLIDYKNTIKVAKNLSASENNLKKLKKELKAAMVQPAEEAGADYFGGILKASKLLPKTAKNPLIMVIGSGYNDTGVLDFAHEDLISKYQKDKNSINQLLNNAVSTENSLLANKNIVWYGLGEVVEPQRNLDDYTNVTTQIYASALSYLGANEVDLEHQSGTTTASTSVDSKHSVTPTYVSSLKVGDTFEVNEAIGEFEADTTILKNPIVVKQKLQSFADKFKSSQKVKLRLTGYIAYCADDNSLSKGRAGVIRDLLVELGIPQNKISVDGKAGSPPEDSGKEFICEDVVTLSEGERRTVKIEVIGE